MAHIFVDLILKILKKIGILSKSKQFFGDVLLKLCTFGQKNNKRFRHFNNILNRKG